MELCGARRRVIRTAEPVGRGRLSRRGRELVDFSSNDYLGLAGDSRLAAASCEAIERWGVGARASRLISGSHPLYEKVEERLAELLGAERVLIFNSGFQANCTVLPVLVEKGGVLLLDRAVHRSLVEGARSSGARLFRFRDEAHLERLLEQHRGAKLWVVTESIFSTDGRRPDLAALRRLADRAGARLLVDEAHAFGMTGEQGLGLCRDADVTVGTFGKAVGVFGAFVATSAELADRLVNHCAGLIYSTALPPAVLGAVDRALELIPEMEAERQAVRALASVLGANSHIIPIEIGTDADALAAGEQLEREGFAVGVLRPPTVPGGRASLRITLSALHHLDDVERLRERIERWSN